MLTDVLKRAFLPRPLQIVGAVAVFTVVLLLVCFATVKSDAYEFADGFVAHDGRIAILTGSQSERRLRWLSGFSMSYGDTSGEASLTLRVEGDRGTFDVPLSLNKKQGRWSVVSAKVINEKGEMVLIVE